ncbi:MAG: hypothetical protein N3F03_04000 [Ignavibacteria bacterium]|nr:hypothetical protein [Ignavibacteria bacterium]
MKNIYIAFSLFSILPFIVGLLSIKKLDNPLKIIFTLVTISVLSNMTLIYFGLVYRNNVWIGHIYTVIEFLCISLFYLSLFERKIFKQIIIGLICLFVIIVVLNKIYLESFHSIDNYSLTISSILLLIISSMFLVEYLTKNLIVDIRDYRFILTIGFMVYFGGNLFIFALSNEVRGIWLVHNLLSISLIIIYTLVFAWRN